MTASCNTQAGAPEADDHQAAGSASGAIEGGKVAVSHSSAFDAAGA
jgi:hypothetical protein